MKHRHVSLVGSWSVLLLCVGISGCSNSGDPVTIGGSGGSSGGPSSGGASLGGTATSGGTTSSSNTGGASVSTGTGGVGQGGTATGGQSPTTGGASAQGGSATGGSSPSTGGANVGGANVGGANVGGANTGGTATGGTASQGGAATGGITATGGAGVAGADTNGKCGLTWAAGGSNGAPATEATVTPVLDSATNNWTFTFGRYKLVVSAAKSGKIYEFSIDGKNIIEPSQGSTFWPSPQHTASNGANYTWPPPSELDGNAYTASMSGNILSLVGATASPTNVNLSFNKRIWVNSASSVVTLEYTIINHASSSGTWAPWEVTRVPAGGYTFAPKGPGTKTIVQDSWQNPLTMSLISGVNWLDYAAVKSTLTATPKNFLAEFDGAEGWLAHANNVGATGALPLLLVKSFPDALEANMPGNEGEIQLWTGDPNTSPAFIEVEEQGEQKTLAASNGQLVWTSHWALCELPSASLLAAGNADLVTFARAHALKP